MPSSSPTRVQEGQEYFNKKALLRPTLANETQTLTVTGSPTGGTFKLKYEGEETSAINHNANAGAIQSALEALSNVGTGDLVVTGTTPNFTVTAAAQLANTPLALLKLSLNSLTGGSLPSVAIARTQAGAGCPRQYVYIGAATQTREVLGEDVTLADITEVGNSGSGYERKRLKLDGVDIIHSFAAGYWSWITKAVTFAASGGDWSEAQSLFLTDDPDGTSGKIIALKSLAEDSRFQLDSGQSIDLTYQTVDNLAYVA